MAKRRTSSGTALITGASRRIGKCIALKLASLGYNIALHYNTSRQMAQATAAEVKEYDVRCSIFHSNLGDEKAVKKLLRDSYKKFVDLNLLVNNASIFEKTDFKKDYLAQLNRHFAINFKAPYILTFEFQRLCQKGQIINILDTNVVKQKTTHLNYLLTKKALRDLTELSAVKLAPKMRVNAIAPGLILPPEDKGNSYLNRLARSIPMKKKGTPQHIAKSVEFLINNDYLTGQIIYVDGGEHLI